MEWFKHYTNAGRNGTILKVKRKYGFAGVGKYWTILELVAQEMRPGDDRCSLELPVKDWAILLGFKPDNLKKFITFLSDICNISHTYLDEELLIEIPKLLKLRDTRNRVRHARGSKDKEEDKDTDKSKTGKGDSDASKGKKSKAKCIDDSTVVYALADREMTLGQFYAEKEVPENFEAWARKKGIPDKTILKVFNNFYEHFSEIERKRWKNWYTAWQKWVQNDVTNFGRTDNKYTNMVSSKAQKKGLPPNATEMMRKDPRYAHLFDPTK